MIIRTDSKLYRFLTEPCHAFGVELMHYDYPPQNTCEVRGALITRTIMLMFNLLRMIGVFVALGIMVIFIPLHVYWLSMGFNMTAAPNGIIELFICMCVIIGSLVLVVCGVAGVGGCTIYALIVCPILKVLNSEWYTKTKEKRCKPVVYENK